MARSSLTIAYSDIEIARQFKRGYSMIQIAECLDKTLPEIEASIRRVMNGQDKDEQ